MDLKLKGLYVYWNVDEWKKKQTQVSMSTS